MSPQVEIQLIGVVVAIACALPGVFLVLRRMALMSDAISHSILLGIVLAFLFVQDLASPLLIIAAAATGLLTVVLVELLRKTHLVKEDAAIGLVFPMLFSIAVILIARLAGDVHLDTDAVLLGELAFAPFDRMTFGDRDVGPKALWVMGSILIVSIVFITVFLKELKITTFDPGLAAALGFSPALVHYAFMSLVSVTAVGAFDAVGSILVVALMIAPPAAAYLLTDRLEIMLVLSAAIAAFSAILGFWAAVLLDASIAGCMAVAVGFSFTAAFLFSPGRGLVAQVLRRARQRRSFATEMLTIHLFNHEGTPEAAEESRVDHLQEHLRWTPPFANEIVDRARRAGLVTERAGRLELTTDGRAVANAALER